MAFTDAHIIEALGIVGCKSFQTCTINHCCRNSNHIGILGRNLTQSFAKHRRVVLFSGLYNTNLRIKTGYTVIQIGMFFCRAVAFPLFGQHMKQNRPSHITRIT